MLKNHSLTPGRDWLPLLAVLRNHNAVAVSFLKSPDRARRATMRRSLRSRREVNAGIFSAFWNNY